MEGVEIFLPGYHMLKESSTLCVDIALRSYFAQTKVARRLCGLSSLCCRNQEMTQSVKMVLGLMELLVNTF